MIWLFAAVVLVLLVYNTGFRRFALRLGGIVAALILIAVLIAVNYQPQPRHIDFTPDPPDQWQGHAMPDPRQSNWSPPETHCPALDSQGNPAPWCTKAPPKSRPPLDCYWKDPAKRPANCPNQYP